MSCFTAAINQTHLLPSEHFEREVLTVVCFLVLSFLMGVMWLGTQVLPKLLKRNPTHYQPQVLCTSEAVLLGLTEFKFK